MKRIIYLILILLFIGINNVKANNSFDTTLKVYDYAQILTDKEEGKLKEDVNNYIDKYNIDMALVTVKYYEQTNVDEYMNLFYNQNKFGIGINKDGIIITIDLKNNTTGIKTFGKATSLYPEDEIQLILNKVNKEDGYYKKLSNFIDNSNKYINDSINNKMDNDSTISINWLVVIIPSIIIPTIVVVIILLKNKNIKSKEENNLCVKSFVINKKDVKFITTNTKKEYCNKKG